tara:strand:- start:761 stop:1003 length:243 start_codon:yes stop_codon:yes gene_type:complete
MSSKVTALILFNKYYKPESMPDAIVCEIDQAAIDSYSSGFGIIKATEVSTRRTLLFEARIVWMMIFENNSSPKELEQHPS